MYETYTTVVGRVASGPDRTVLADGGHRVHLRVASTPRRQDRSSGQWVDGETMYLSVVCWRKLAANVHASLSVGDPVMVHGKLRARSYQDREGAQVTTQEIEALAVGPNLMSCTSTVLRPPRSGGAEDQTVSPADTAADRGPSSEDRPAAGDGTGGMSDDPWSTDAEASPDDVLGPDQQAGPSTSAAGPAGVDRRVEVPF